MIDGRPRTGLIPGTLSLGLGTPPGDFVYLLPPPADGLTFRAPTPPNFFFASDGVDGIVKAGPAGNFGRSDPELCCILFLFNFLLCSSVGVDGSDDPADTFGLDDRLPVGDEMLRRKSAFSIFGVP